MKIVIINGQNHKGSTYNVAHILAEKIGGEIQDFFLPRDFGEFCVGCCQCFKTDEKLCPHYEKLQAITKAMDEADVIILASPVYVYHATGAMKNFLDHYGYRWVVHSPEPSMFRKQGVAISTAAGAGMKSTNKDMKDSLFFWGVGRIYEFGKAVAAINWNSVSDKNKKIVDVKTTKLANKIKRRYGKVTPSLKTKIFFMLMRKMQINGFNPRDVQYWEKMGWTGKARPWK